jgi:hypothetical protein
MNNFCFTDFLLFSIVLKLYEVCNLFWITPRTVERGRIRKFPTPVHLLETIELSSFSTLVYSLELYSTEGKKKGVPYASPPTGHYR